MGTPGPHTCSDTGGSPRATTVPSVLQRISRGRIPAPHRATPGRWPSRAWHAWAPASHASVRLAGARECLQSGRDAAAEAEAGANSAHAGRCPRERGAFYGARITPRAGSAELAPWGAPLSLFPRRWSVQAVCADLQGLSGAATPVSLKGFIGFGFCSDEKILEENENPLSKGQFRKQRAVASPALLRGRGLGRKERGASANCSFVRFRVWEAAVRALISAAHYPG